MSLKKFYTTLYRISICLVVLRNQDECCYLTISSPASLSSFCSQYFPVSRYFPMSQLFPSGGQNIGALAAASNLSNEYSGLVSFRIDWFDLLAVQGTLKSLLQHHSLEDQFFSTQHSASLWSNSHI